MRTNAAGGGGAGADAGCGRGNPPLLFETGLQWGGGCRCCLEGVRAAGRWGPDAVGQKPGSGASPEESWLGRGGEGNGGGGTLGLSGGALDGLGRRPRRRGRAQPGPRSVRTRSPPAPPLTWGAPPTVRGSRVLAAARGAGGRSAGWTAERSGMEAARRRRHCSCATAASAPPALDQRQHPRLPGGGRGGIAQGRRPRLGLEPGGAGESLLCHSRPPPQAPPRVAPGERPPPHGTPAVDCLAAGGSAPPLESRSLCLSSLCTEEGIRAGAARRGSVSREGNTGGFKKLHLPTSSTQGLLLK